MFDTLKDVLPPVDQIYTNNETLKDVLPPEFFGSYDETRTAKFLDKKVKRQVDSRNEKFPGTHKYVYVWWELESRHAVGWNENPAIGWSFPIVKIK